MEIKAEENLECCRLSKDFDLLGYRYKRTGNAKLELKAL